MFNNPSFYNGVVKQSLRFGETGNPSLSWSPSSAGNRKKWTFSTWVKRSNLDSGDQYIFSQATGSNNNDSFMALIFRDDDLDVTCHSLEVLRSDAKFRDVGAWYHILWVLDTENSTASHRMRLYVNGDEITSFSTDNRSNSQLNGTNMPILNNATHYIGRYGGDTSRNFSGYLAYTELVEGEALTPSSFTEEKNGVLIPIEYSGDHGTYGFRLEYKETGDGSSSPSSSTIGADTKSNATKQHWNDNNLDVYDSNIPDSPENNFCTLNSIGRRYGQSYTGTFTEGSLKVASSGNASSIFATMAINQIASQGGIYFEVRLDSVDTVRTYVGVIGDSGINNKNSSSNGASYSFPIKGLLRPTGGGSPNVYFLTDTDGSGSVDLSSHNSTYSNGDIVGVAILSDGKTFFHKNGTYLDDSSGNVCNPSTGANPIGTIDLTEGDWLPYVGYNSTFTVNFGQDDTFGGQESSGGNSDANDIGRFKYAVPTNCLALCTSNMVEPAIGPNSNTQADDHFNTLLYTGNSTNNRAITGLGFQPDWVWIKKRNGTMSHFVVDSSRGLASNGSGNGNFRQLATNATYHEEDTSNNTSDGGMASFDADGFTLGKGSNDANADSAYQRNNANSSTYVAWNWKANGGTKTTVSIDDISSGVPSIASEVQANTKAGFSIVLYTGTGASSGTIAHGLGAVPKQIWVKNRDEAYNWKVYHAENTSAPETDYLVLDTTDATVDSATHWNDTAPDANVFTIGSSNGLIKNTNKYVAYCFAEIEGYSKFGSYTSNNSSTDNAFVYTGFRPAFLLVKMTPSNTEWVMMDNKKSSSDGGNPIDKGQYPNYTNAEYNGNKVDFLSNGFKVRDTSGVGYSTRNVIYMAFAETPFKFANAR